MSDLTVITPIAPHHALLFEECAASVQGQTVEVEHLYMLDNIGQGPAVVRNLLLERVQSPFVTFLDADDWLEPHFSARTLQAVHPARYVYTDWYQEGSPVTAPDCAWTGGTFHLVTAVLPTAWAREVGGFDETLRGMEDTDFYVKMATRGFCGCRLPVPLVHYRKDGGRAKRIHSTGEVNALNELMKQRYGELRVSCCGDNTVIQEEVPAGERGPQDVKARSLWHGNRKEMGRVTGRHYPRSGNGKLLWVHPADVHASPHLWQTVPEVEQEPELPKV